MAKNLSKAMRFRMQKTKQIRSEIVRRVAKIVELQQYSLARRAAIVRGLMRQIG